MKSNSSTGRLRIISIFVLLLAFVGFILAVFWFMVSPVSASLFAAPNPTQENMWASVDIPKPVQATALPLGTLQSVDASTPEIVATPATFDLPTATPEVVLPDSQTAATEEPGTMSMQVVDDTPVPVQQQASDTNPVPAAYSGSKYILVDISEQHMYVYDGDTLVFSFIASTGMNNATRVGTFQVLDKIPNAYGSTWNIWMPKWLGIYWSGTLENGIHALPILPNGSTLWEGFLGRPISYGCVVLGTYDAQMLYDWAEVGTPVEIQW